MYTHTRGKRETKAYSNPFLADIQNIENNWRLGKWFKFSVDLGAVVKQTSG